MRKLLCLIVITLIITACDRQSSDEIIHSTSVVEDLNSGVIASSSSIVDPSSSSMIISSPLIESSPYTQKRETPFIIYEYFPNGEIFEGYTYELGDATTIADVVSLVGEYLDFSFHTVSATQQKGYIVITFGEEIINQGKDKLHIALQTLATTLFQNGDSIESFHFKLDSTMNLGSSDPFELAQFRLSESTAEEFTIIRAEAPYIGMQEIWDMPHYGLTDETALTLLDILTRIGFLGEEFLDITKIDDQGVLYNDLMFSALMATNHYYRDASIYEGSYHRAELLPLFTSISEKIGFAETQIWLKDDIEGTAKRLYGEDFPISHKELSTNFPYWEVEGVYSPPHRGGGISTHPSILDYTIFDDYYEVEVAYYGSSMGGYFDLNYDDFTIIEEANLASHIKTEATRYIVTISREDEDSLSPLTLHSNRLKR